MHLLLAALACLQPDATDSGAAPGVATETQSEAESLVRADPTQPTDIDGDGYTFLNGDCDDLDPDRHPGREELCNELDDNCDGVIDEDTAIDATTWYDDSDGDGYGRPASAETGCSPPADTVPTSGDCDDEDPLANPGEEEVCEDGVDNDCDGHDSTCATGLTDADVSWWGSDRADTAGSAVASGDWNGDGATDLLVGATGVGTDGRVYAVLGPLTASGRLEAVGVTWDGVGTNDGFGDVVSSAGDLDGDGLEDLAVGDSLADDQGTDSGSVSILMGSSLPVTGAVSSPTSHYHGGTSKDYAGVALASVGDADSDGVDDLLVGATGAAGDETGSGVAYLVTQHTLGQAFLANISSQLRGAVEGDEAGSSVAGPGDVDGDGVPDLLVGAVSATGGDTYSGKAYLVLGPVTGDMSLADSDAILSGVALYDDAGASVGSAGDQDGDGLPDLFVGAPRAASHAGVAYVLSGLTTGPVSLDTAAAKLVGEDGNDDAGTDLTCLGDADGDGFDDLLVGAPETDDAGTSSGTAYVVIGPVSGTVGLGSADRIWSGIGDWAYAGRSVASPGDVDGDGLGDALVAAPEDNVVDRDAGAVYLLLGGGL